MNNAAPIPFNEGFIERDSGHKIYFHEYGNVNGEPVLQFHGGPGTFSKPKHCLDFDLKRYRVILFDQRGVGKSQFVDRFANNDIEHTLDDAKAILDSLKIKKTHIVSSSFGALLSLCFAKKYPQMVSRMILSSVFLGRKQDINWILHGYKIFYPEVHEKVFNHHKTVRNYYDMIKSGLEHRQIVATKLFGSYERHLGNLEVFEDDDYIPSQEHIDANKIYLYYMYHNMTLETSVLNDIEKISNIPLTIIHNRLDFNTPVIQAFDLHKALPNSKLIIVPDYGHKSEKLTLALQKELKDE